MKSGKSMVQRGGSFKKGVGNLTIFGTNCLMVIILIFKINFKVQIASNVLT